jgi:general secretion pathway protein D
MTPRFARLSLAAFLSAVVPFAHAQPPAPGAPTATPAIAPAGSPDEPVALKLPNADIDTVISLLEQYTGKIALRPATLPTATYNLEVPKKIPKSEAIVYLQTILAMNRIGLAPLGPNAFKVVDLTMTKSEAPEMINGSTFDRPASGNIATKVFQLDFLRVAELQQMVQTMLNPNVQGFIALQNANAAIITDSVSNLQRVELLLRDLDRPTGGLKPKFYTLKNGAKASDLVGKLRTILSGPLQLQLGQATTYSADDRTNQIVVVTDPRQHDFFDDLITKLDVKSDPNTRNEVIILKHAEATKVSTLLTQLVTGQTAAAQRAGGGQSVRPGQTTPSPAAPAAPVAAATAIPSVDSVLGGTGSNEFSGLVTIIPDERTNAVVVSGTVDDIRLLTALIEKLDTILAQVRLEVVIAEVTLDDSSSTGISALGLKIDGDKLIGFSGSLAGAAVSAGTVTRTGATVSGPWDLAGELAISSTPRKNTTNILSSPSITTTHNKEAIFFFGETRPVISGTTATPTSGGTATGFSTQSNITPQEIGTKITVKPLIGIDGTVQLDIKQDISDVTGTVQIDNNTQYIIGKRQTTSYITARSGQIYVLAGYQKDKDSRNSTRLGPIPFIGDLLGSRSKSNNRVELVIFLRPVVLKNSNADTTEAMNRVEKLEQKEVIKQRLDPTYTPPPKTIIEKVFK